VCKGAWYLAENAWRWWGIGKTPAQHLHKCPTELQMLNLQLIDPTIAHTMLAAGIRVCLQGQFRKFEILLKSCRARL
jgi:hypothetical protein